MLKDCMVSVSIIEKSLDLYKNALILFTPLQCYSKNASLSNTNVHLDGSRVPSLGKIASHYYVTYNSMMVYTKHLKPTMSTLELFKVFALSNEFKLIPVRQEVSLMCLVLGG